jgi:hypothetical protein
MGVILRAIVVGQREGGRHGRTAFERRDEAVGKVIEFLKA